MYDHILISSDGSALAQLGVEHGLALAKLHGSKVTAVTVTEPLGGQFAFASDLWTPSEAEVAAYDAAQRRIAERILAPIQNEAEEIGIAIETVHVPWRLVAGALLQVADEVGCDVIVMSSHGRTGMDRVAMGSQTAEVINRAKVPVIVVR
jgi:nucleotide-binding universal stress UspA family protein